MFEELYALAILYANGFDTGKRFQDVMNEMTLQGKEGDPGAAVYAAERCGHPYHVYGGSRNGV